MSPERVLAKDIDNDKYVLIMGTASKELIPNVGDRLIWIFEKYPGLEFSPSDLTKVEIGLFNMRTMRNSRQVGMYRIATQDLGDALTRYILLNIRGDVIATNIRTLAMCQKLAVEAFCEENNYCIINRF